MDVIAIMATLFGILQTPFQISIQNFLFTLAFSAITAGFAGAIWFNPWFKRQFAWRMGWATKGFAIIMDNGRNILRRDFDPTTTDFEFGKTKENTHIINPETIYNWGGIPVTFINVNNTESLNLYSKKEGQGQWMDPVQMHAFIVRLKDLIEARMMARGLNWRDIALGAAAVFGLFTLLGVYLVFDQGKMTQQICNVAASEATRIVSKLGA